MPLIRNAARRALADAEKAQAEAVADRQALEERLKTAEARLHELEAKLEEEGRESSDLELLRQRLKEEMEDARKQHQQDLAERDFDADQTRKNYQSKYLFLPVPLVTNRSSCCS